MELQDIITFYGRQSNPHKFTAQADVYVCSSYNEGYSTACLEALMLGIPLISIPVSGVQEMIEDAGCGPVVGMEDEELYQGLKYVLQNPKILSQWKNILQKTQNRFSCEYRIHRLVRLWNLQ